jgi:hypothetical protein
MVDNIYPQPGVVMADIKSVGDLEINQDLRFQKKEWAFERWGWIIMVILVIAGLLGLFGQGPLSTTTAKNGTLQVEYERFGRELAPAQFQVQVDPQQANSGEVKLQVERDLLSFYTVDKIIPEPDSTELSPEQVTYIFKTAPRQGPLEVTFDFQGDQTGIAQGKIGVEDGPAVDISQVIYP